MKKEWLERIYNDSELNLSDRELARICGISSHTTIRKWRDKHSIPTKEPSGKWLQDGYVILYMPKTYQHPEKKSVTEGNGRQTQFEHITIMEKHLMEHPELEISKMCLINDKYLKRTCVVHHINHIRQDNRLENLYLFKNQSEHKKSEKTLYDCFKDLIKLNQISFKNGRYYLNENFDYKKLSPSKIKKLLKIIPINYYEDINLVKEEIQNLKWKDISENWTVKYRVNRNSSYKSLLLDPYSDCSKNNPLYRHKAWLKYLVNDERYNLTDRRIGMICGVPLTTILYWRNKHQIKGKKEFGFKRFKTNGRVYIKVPTNYGNPFAKKNKGYMLEYRYVVEKYLAKHPQFEISQRSLINGKYLKTEFLIHHINFDSLDNRLENLWICKNGTEHKRTEGSLLVHTDKLLKSNLIYFKNGKYYLAS